MSVASLREALNVEVPEIEKAKQRLEMLSQRPLPSIGRDSIRHTQAVVEAFAALKSAQYKIVFNES